jgi:hypothetical protein
MAAIPPSVPSELLTIQASYMKNSVSPMCNGAISAPKYHQTLDGVLWPTIPLRAGFTYSQPCGMVLVEMTDHRYIAAFGEKVCHAALDLTVNDDCTSQFRRTFIARLSERYRRADFVMLKNRCEAHPIECDNLATVELWTIESHNDGVLAVANRQLQEFKAAMREAEGVRLARAQELQRQQAENAQRRRQRWAAALQAVSDAFKQCHTTTTAFGSTSYSSTTCH